ncbi:DoxX family protein [Rhodococcus sp. D2-41]|uniref:DoxX family protein n=1 Tax=Speluncibacter jeojiensis TaxID=2710754 RepID=UPI002410982A|nr:DoxX family protein [Rhodococcus sp. D2-41]MDG3012239.1 DoxX family protein [Rhodococcus sp. D2-41]
MTPSPFRSVVVLLARVGLGVIFFAHGWQKFFTWGIDGTQASFDKMGAPLPDVSAVLAATVELVGGAALIVGLAVPVFAVLLFLDMLGAYFIVHAGHGIFIGGGGYELVLGLGTGALLLAVTGAGRFSVDQLLGSRAIWNRRPVAA